MVLKYTCIFIVIFIFSGKAHLSLIDLHKVKSCDSQINAFSLFHITFVINAAKNDVDFCNFQLLCLAVASLTFLFLCITFHAYYVLLNWRFVQIC